MGEVLWRVFVKVAGGLHGYGWSPLCVCIHDRGLMLAWRQIVVFDGVWFPSLPLKGSPMTDTPMVEMVAASLRDAHSLTTMATIHSDDYWLGQARAAIAAMREPTEAMKFVGGTKCENLMFGGDPEYTGIIFDDMGVVYREMIDAAALTPSEEK